MKRTLTLITMLCLAATHTGAATVYKKVDEQGNIIFSDTPMDDAETLNVQPVPTIKLDKMRVPQPVERKEKPTTPTGYSSLTITSPQPEETFWNTGGSVDISVQTAPALQPNHKIQLLLNGEMRAGPSASQSFSFSNLFRGSYKSIAQVVDDKGNVLISSPTVTFHIKQASRLN